MTNPDLIEEILHEVLPDETEILGESRLKSIVSTIASGQAPTFKVANAIGHVDLLPIIDTVCAVASLIIEVIKLKGESPQPANVQNIRVKIGTLSISGQVSPETTEALIKRIVDHDD